MLAQVVLFKLQIWLYVVIKYNSKGAEGQKFSYIDSLKAKEQIIKEETLDKLLESVKASSDFNNVDLTNKTIRSIMRTGFKNPNEKSTCGCGESFSV